MWKKLSQCFFFTFFLLQIDKSSILSNAGTVPVKLSVALFVVTCDELAGLMDTSTAVIIMYTHITLQAL